MAAMVATLLLKAMPGNTFGTSMHICRHGVERYAHDQNHIKFADTNLPPKS